MKALVLAGGEGTRLRPFSYSMPKQLIPVANKPVLEYVLENITDLGVREIGVIVGEWAPEIARALGDGSRFGASLTYLPQDRPYGLAQCVMLARDFLGDEDFVMYLGDNILPAGVAEFAHEFATGQPAAQLVVHKVADPTAFGVAELDADGVVLRLEEQPASPSSDLTVVGVYFFSPAIHQAAAAIRPSARGELEITDAIQWLIENEATVRASEYGGYWKDTGRIEDVLECNRKLLDGLRPHLAGEVDTASRLTGAVVVEPGARVLRSRIAGPVIIGAGSLIEDGHIGPAHLGRPGLRAAQHPAGLLHRPGGDDGLSCPRAARIHDRPVRHGREPRPCGFPCRARYAAASPGAGGGQEGRACLCGDRWHINPYRPGGCRPAALLRQAPPPRHV